MDDLSKMSRFNNKFNYTKILGKPHTLVCGESWVSKNPNKPHLKRCGKTQGFFDLEEICFHALNLLGPAVVGILDKFYILDISEKLLEGASYIKG